MRRFVLCALTLFLASPLFAATKTWTGTAGTLWSQGSNWGGTLPVGGEDLVFPNGALNLTNLDDFLSFSFSSITVGTGYTLNATADLFLGAGGLTVSSGTPTVSIPFNLTAAQQWTVPTGAGLTYDAGAGTLVLNGNTLTLSSSGSATPSISAPIQFPGTIIKIGDGAWTLSGNNTNSGQLQINAGYLIAGSANAFGVADNTPANGTIVNSGGSLNLGNFTFPAEYITLNGSGQGGNGSLQASGNPTLTGTVVLATNVAMNFLAGQTVTFNGMITGPGAFGMGNPGTYVLNNAGNNFTGAVTWGASGGTDSTLRLGVSNALPATVSLNVGAGGAFDVNGQTQTITSLSGPGNVMLGSGGNLTITNPSGSFDGTMSGSGSVVMSGGNSIWNKPNTYTGTFSHTGGTFRINGAAGGSLTAAFTQSAGTFGISSNATAGAVTINGGTIDPGNGGTGVANTGNLTLAGGATYAEGINATAPASFGNVHVTGTVNLGGATFNLTGTGAGVVPGNTFIIIDNDGVDPVVGTFAGLLQGATITGGPGGLNYTISYVGGTGNDVVLTAAAAAAAVPALDPRALIALGCVLAAVALLALRR